MSRRCLCGATRCCTGGFAKLVTGNIENGKAPPPFWECLEIRLDKNLDRLFAGVNLNTNRRIAKVHLVASSVLSSNDGVGWGITSESLEIQSRPKPRLRLSHDRGPPHWANFGHQSPTGSPLPFVIGRVIHDEGVLLADLEERQLGEPCLSSGLKGRPAMAGLSQP
jgi:hypothetical protein